MHKPQSQVIEFHRALGVTVGDTPAIRDAELRAKLIIEEAVETASAIVGHDRATDLVLKALSRPVKTPEPDLAEAVDGLCVGLVVTYGTAAAFGIDLEPFYDEVHRTNMAKAGGPVRADGKRLKPPGWQPPRIREMLADIPRLRQEKLDAARQLAERHFALEEGLVEVYCIDEGMLSDAPIKLLKVSNWSMATGEITPFRFSANFVIAEIAPHELEHFKSHPEKIPAGWSLDRAVKFTRRRRSK